MFFSFYYKYFDDNQRMRTDDRISGDFIQLDYVNYQSNWSFLVTDATIYEESLNFRDICSKS